MFDDRDGGGAEIALAAALGDLHRHNVTFATLRDPGRDGRGVLEADLLIHPDDRARAEARLAATGFRRRPGWGRHPHRFLLRPVTGAGAVDWLKLDVVSDLCFGPRHQWVTDLGAACLRDRTVGAGAGARLAAADELVAHLLHALLDRGTVRAKDAVALRALADRVEGPGHLARALTEPGVGPASFPGIVSSIRAERWDEVAATSSELRQRVARRHPVRGAGRAARSRLLRRSSRALAPLAGRGPLVALLGPDGTGKTTLVTGLVGASGVPTRVLYGGTYRSGTGSTVPGLATARVVTRLLGTRVAVGWHRRCGRLVVLDRHPEQARPLRTDDLSRTTRLRRQVLAATLPAPDLTLVLDAPPEVLHDRRPEHTVAHLARDRARHLDLRGPGDTVVVVDAASPAASVQARSIDLIWRHAIPPRVRHHLTATAP